MPKSRASGRINASRPDADRGQQRALGPNELIRFGVGDSSLGAILVASSVKGIAAILIGDDRDTLARELRLRFSKAHLSVGDKDYESVVAQVTRFAECPRLEPAFPLDLRGTAFQKRVWQAVREIPAGRTVSYTRIALTIGAPTSARAVARACAANTIALAIPCHRVVRNDGTLSGYAWGRERKRMLIEREAALLPSSRI